MSPSKAKLKRFIDHLDSIHMWREEVEGELTPEQCDAITRGWRKRIGRGLGEPVNRFWRRNGKA